MAKQRILAAFAALVMTLAASAAVYFLAPSGFDAGSVREGITYDVTGVASDAVIARLGDNGATADMYTYWLGTNASYLAAYLPYYTGEAFDLAGTLPDGSGIADYIAAQTLEVVRQQLVLENLAAEYGVTLSEEEEAELAEQRASYIASFGGEEGYRAELAKLGVSEATFDRLRRMDYLYAAIYDVFCTPGSALDPGDETLLAYAAEHDYITVDHILIMTLDPDTYEELDEAAAAEKRALAGDLLARLRASNDPITLFDELADEYSEDTGRLLNPDGYTIDPETNFVPEFMDAAYALEENEISELVESSYGCHILLRRPLDAAAAVAAVRDAYFDEFFQDAVASAELAVSPELERFDTVALCEALMAAQSA